MGLYMESECQEIETYITKVCAIMDRIFYREDKYYSEKKVCSENYSVVYDEFLRNQKKLRSSLREASSAITDLEITLRSLAHEKTRMETINDRRVYDLARELERDSAIFRN